MNQQLRQERPFGGRGIVWIICFSHAAIYAKLAYCLKGQIIISARVKSLPIDGRANMHDQRIMSALLERRGESATS